MVGMHSHIGIKTFSGFEIFGWMMFFYFSLMGLYSGWIMSWVGRGTPLPIDCPNVLVTNGPYKYLRNPMAVAGIGQGISVGLILGSWMVILYAISGAFLWHFLVRPAEEADLQTRFGKEYMDYKVKVRLWWPRQLNFFN